MAMIVGIAVVELHIPAARSLKQKRRVVRGLVERVHQRLRISTAETDFHDLHQRAEIGLALVSTDERECRRLFDQARSLFDEEPEAVVTVWDPQYLEGEA